MRAVFQLPASMTSVVDAPRAVSSDASPGENQAAGGTGVHPLKRPDPLKVSSYPGEADAPICQDTRSGSQVCGLARSVVCHHALKDLAGEKACETADDLPFGPPFSGASFDVVEGW